MIPGYCYYFAKYSTLVVGGEWVLVHPADFKSVGSYRKVAAVGSIPSRLRQFVPTRRASVRLREAQEEFEFHKLRLRHSIDLILDSPPVSHISYVLHEENNYFCR